MNSEDSNVEGRHCNQYGTCDDIIDEDDEYEVVDYRELKNH